MQDKIHFKREQILREIFSEIPALFGFKLLHFSDVSYFRSESCLVCFSWERYDSKLIATEFFDPSVSETEGGMSYWILEHVLGFKADDRIKTPYRALGHAISAHCDRLLQGDFSVRQEYDALEPRILNHIDRVIALPDDHPTRVLFEARDLQWLTDMERQRGWF